MIGISISDNSSNDVSSRSIDISNLLQRTATPKRQLLTSNSEKHSSSILDQVMSPEIKSTYSEELTSVSHDDSKRLKPEAVTTDSEESQIKPLYVRRRRNFSMPLFVEVCDKEFSELELSSEIVIRVSMINIPRLQFLLRRELYYHPNNAFLYYVNPVVEEKVDASLRNEAVQNLRFMHSAFFTLSAETFCKAVNLIDRFVVKVKVKPKYMACVATAAYYIASKLSEKSSELSIPSPDVLVQISHCGGNTMDLLRMEEILQSKLNGDLDGVNAFDFLKLFASAAVIFPDTHSAGICSGSSENSFAFEDDFIEKAKAEREFVGETNENVGGQPLFEDFSQSCFHSVLVGENKIKTFESRTRRLHDLWNGMTNRLIVALCSLEIYRFRPAILAISILQHSRVSGIPSIAQLCKIDMREVNECTSLVDELYDVYFRDPYPSSRQTLIWTLSRRTFLRIGCSSVTPLDTISEDCENDDDDDDNGIIKLLFEP